ITSELVTNAVQHACDDGTTMIGVALTHAGSPAAVTIIVSDCTPGGPVLRDTPPGSEQGRGLQIVEALSAHWGWRQAGSGKAVFAVLVREACPVMADISALPMLHDIDADYSPQYVKLARILRGKIESGQYRRGDSLPAAELASQHKVSIRVTCNALAMLAANRYVSRPGAFRSYSVTWQAGASCPDGSAASMRSRRTRPPSSARTSGSCASSTA